MADFNLDQGKAPSLLQELVHSLKVKDAMTADIVTCVADVPLSKIQYLMKTNRISGVPIVENGKSLIGIISVDDIMKALENNVIDDPVSSHMTRNIVVLEDEMPLSVAISYMDKYTYRRFPVIDKNNFLVGVLSSRDILGKLLTEMNSEVAKIETQIPVPSNLELNDLHKTYFVRKFDFENAGKASGGIKKILAAQGIDAKTIRRASVAAYELEMNIVIHSQGGKLMLIIHNDSIEIVAQDVGPGIKNVEEALQEGFSTANAWIRSQGFGAGMGLANIKRVSDDFSIESLVGEGTTVNAKIHITKGDSNEIK